MLRKYAPVIFVLIFNLWIAKIFRINFLIGILTTLATISLYTKKFTFALTLFILLLFFQYKTSAINSLTYLNDNEKTRQIEKMHGYPPKFYRFANWLEARPETLIYYKLEANLSEVVNPNLYFFANHPRERAAIVEYEKFPYILLPFLVLGVLSTKKKDLKYLFLSLSPFLLISAIGNTNPMGPFSLFPFLAANTAFGLKPVFEKKTLFFIFIVIFGLVFIQTYTYATH